VSLDYRQNVGVVVIGRNEGERLERSLRSVVNQADPVVYVDSGSTDGSTEFARSLGVDVIELDTSRPFTMARGRNAGLRRIAELAPNLSLVQFVDGDCEIVDGWLDKAREFLNSHEEFAVVCGRRRERCPNASIYNRLCDIEWDAPLGEALACGGDAMMRSRAVLNAGGYNANMIAGEEAELCLRLRRAGWKLMRLGAEMTLHDAAITRFAQWWRRAVRTGYAYAHGAALHGGRLESHNVRPLFSALLWGAILPGSVIVTVALALAATPWTWTLTASLIAAQAFLALRVYRRTRQQGRTKRDAVLSGASCLLAKPAHLAGIVRYVLGQIRKRQSSLIEYKDTSAS
jgi:glycosyltransferase involved in cell wall biosynthesis